MLLESTITHTKYNSLNQYIFMVNKEKSKDSKSANLTGFYKRIVFPNALFKVYVEI